MSETVLAFSNTQTEFNKLWKVPWLICTKLFLLNFHEKKGPHPFKPGLFEMGPLVLNKRLAILN